MVDTKSPGDKTLSVPSKTLTLKPRVETGTVRQSFSHGRTKQVLVEKRGKRRLPGEAPAPETHAPEPVAAKAAPAKAPLARPAAAAPAQPRNASGVVLRTLTEDERSARASALADAKVRDIEERKIAEEEAKRRASREGIEQAEREAAEARRKAAEAARPSDGCHRAQCGRGARAFDRLVPPPHPAPEGTCLERAKGKAHPRSHNSRSHHHPGTRQPHDRARGRRHPPVDEAGRDAQ